MIMIVISFALVKFYAFAILYVLIVMQIKLVVVVVVASYFASKILPFESPFPLGISNDLSCGGYEYCCWLTNV